MILHMMLNIYLLVLVLNVIVGALSYNQMDTALKVLYLLLVLTLVDETINAALDFKWANHVHHDFYKSCISNVFSMFEFSLTALYFLYTIWKQPDFRIKCLIPITCVTIGLLNVWLQPPTQYNTNMLVIESITISAMGLYVFFRLMIREDIMYIFQYPHFRIWAALITCWTATFFYWLLLKELKKDSAQYTIVEWVHAMLVIVIYVVIGSTLLQLRKKKHYKPGIS